MNGDLVQRVLNNSKKGKIFLGKYAIYERTFRISSFGLTCFANSRLTGTYIYWYFACFQVSEGEKKNQESDNDVFKT